MSFVGGTDSPCPIYTFSSCTTPIPFPPRHASAECPFLSVLTTVDTMA